MTLSRKHRALALTLASCCLWSATVSCLKRPAKPQEKEVQDKADDTQEQRTPAALDKAVVRENLSHIFSDDYDCDKDPITGNKKQLRLLTRSEFNNSVRDLFQLQGQYYSGIPIEQKVFGFKNNADVSLVSSDHASAYVSIAKDIATEVVDTRWKELMDCPVSAGTSCAEAFIKKFGPKVWRSPLTDSDFTALMTLHKAGSEISAEEGLKLIVRGMLNSSRFLYRSELGADGKLDSFERATALSYFFWGTTPDDLLLSLAQSGNLMSDDELLRQARRLLLDKRAKIGLSAFADALLNYSAVLNVNKDSAKYPQFTSDLRKALHNETEDFFDYVVRHKNANFEELFLAPYSLGSNSLSEFYKAPVLTEGEYQKLDFSGQKRKGILGQASVLASLAYATETGPIQRGVFIREHLLCEVMSPPPPNLQIVPPPPKEGATTRERFAEHTASPACAGCHKRIDGIGFGMEDFDAIGLVRTEDNGKSLDASGMAVDLDGKDLSFTGTSALAEALASSTRAKKCMVVQAFRMANGRLESDADICSIRKAASTFVEKNLSLSDLLILIATDPTFLNRRP